MDNEEKRKRSQQLHKESQKMHDREQNALCFVVLGGIALVIGIVFLFLSFVMDNNVRYLDYDSLAFIVFVLFLAIGVGSLGFGLTKFFLAFSRRRKVIQEINSLK